MKSAKKTQEQGSLKRTAWVFGLGVAFGLFPVLVAVASRGFGPPIPRTLNTIIGIWAYPGIMMTMIATGGSLKLLEQFLWILIPVFNAAFFGITFLLIFETRQAMLRRRSRREEARETAAAAKVEPLPSHASKPPSKGDKADQRSKIRGL